MLAAMGRVPATAGLFAGVEPAMERGFLQVNERFQTSIPSLYAIGDAIGGAMLAHKAEAEGCAAADLLLGRAPVRGVSPVPACVYTDPEIAQVGLTADDCKARGIPFAAGKCVMGGNGRTLIAGGKRGFLKLVFHAQTHAPAGGLSVLLPGHRSDFRADPRGDPGPDGGAAAAPGTAAPHLFRGRHRSRGSRSGGPDALNGPGFKWESTFPASCAMILLYTV